MASVVAAILQRPLLNRKLLPLASQLSSLTIQRLTPVEKGQQGTLSYRVFLSLENASGSGNSVFISPWHDVPLKSRRSMVHSPIFHFVNEISRGSTSKYEIASQEEFNPIKQDVKNGQLRILKHGPVLHNYGCLPQTWEDPSIRQTPEQLPGDNDPVDVVEIGEKKLATGQVIEVKLLGALALVDENECDWKLIAINTEDERAASFNDIEDVPKQVIDDIREWYRVYKVSEGKQANRYAYNGQAFGKDFARSIAEECHTMWKSMRKSEAEDVANERLNS